MSLTRNPSKSCFPEPVMVEILSRLPVKSLLRFRCVCTHWRTLISSPFFVSLNLSCSISNHTRHSILVHDTCKYPPLSFVPFTFSPIQNLDSMLYKNYCFDQEVMYAGSINGLLCLIGSTPDIISIWNPSTRLFKTIPPGKYRGPSSVSCGFGWDPVANDYKVVRIGSKCEDGKSWAEVWSANLESWREINVDGNFIPLRRVSDVTLKGFAHWIVRDGNNMKPLVASFDMSTEILQLVPLPELLLQMVPITAILVGERGAFCMNWKETFALAGLVMPEPKKIYQVWTMENDSVRKELWSKKFTFELDVEFYRLLCSVNGKFVLVRRGEVILYDVETRETKTIGILKFNWLVLQADYYVESLVSVKGFTPIGEDAKKMELQELN
ncbi:putative F-box protein At1g32420 [Olea europaea var. sylvestris]|uniref:putative F-box protein At1g32420 n=1 Tax=Olea europaea var. sylvestris TaxID=158386 RepID=UPI000C1D0F9A|nr:putative F-box protein At1g32420 [Olea europaea var. sylvestris]